MMDLIKRHVRYIITFLFIAAALSLSRLAFAAEPFELHLLDVGEGQSVLIEADGSYMLIDGGGRDRSSYVVSYLQQQGVEILDYVVASHYDEDHMAGLIGALSVFPAQMLLLPSYEMEGDLYQSFSAAALSNGCVILHPETGQTFQMGQASIEIVGPVYKDYTLENDRSLALKVSYGNIFCLICGDAQQQSESDMAASGADLRADIYVVDHHGSGSSSTEAFLDAVSPTYALISCGAHNAYGHPAAETMRRLCGHGCKLFRTDLQGTVIAYSDGNAIWFNTDPCEDWTAGDLSYKIEESSGTDDADSDSTSEENKEDSESSVSAETGLSETDGNGTGAAGLPKTDAGATGTADADQAADSTSWQYVCNTNTKKFHYPDCSSVAQMKEENRLYTDLSRDELIAQGYAPCGNCRP